MEQIQALRFEVDQVGKHVKGSKKRYTWDISLKDKHHTIILDFSFISGKVKITVDRKILLQNELPSNVSFQYPFTLDGFALNIIQQGESFELRINNKVFSHLYNQHKTNTEFKRYEEEVKDIKVNIDQLNPQKQKIELKIGAFGGMQKKKKDVTGGAEGWNAFSGGSFPNYFGDQAPKEQSKPVPSPKKKANLLDEDDEETTVPMKVEQPKPKTQMNLLGDDQPQKPVESAVEVTYPSQVSSVPAQDDFNTMQNMFSTMKVNQPEPQQTTSNQMDFFADEPKKESPTKVNPPNSAVIFDINMSSASTSSNNFATGYGLPSSNVDPRAFATSATGNKPLEVDFFNLPPKQEVTTSAFSKKPEASSAQMENILSGQGSQKSVAEVSSPLTDMSANDFSMSKPVPPPSADDFSTMQNLFQTSNPSTIQGMSMNQPNQPSGILMSSNAGVPATVPNEGDFSTLQQMFQTNNYSNLNSKPAPQTSEQKAPQVDFSKNSNQNPQSAFATMGGAPSATSGFDFDMSSFGTMQAGQKPKDNNFDFFGEKSANKASTGNDLI